MWFPEVGLADAEWVRVQGLGIRGGYGAPDQLPSFPESMVLLEIRLCCEQRLWCIAAKSLKIMGFSPLPSRLLSLKSESLPS